MEEKRRERRRSVGKGYIIPRNPAEGHVTTLDHPKRNRTSWNIIEVQAWEQDPLLGNSWNCVEPHGRREKQEKGPFRNSRNVLEHSAQPPVNSINRPQLKLQEVPPSK